MIYILGLSTPAVRRVVCVSPRNSDTRVQAPARWGIAPRMKAVTPVRLAHAPRKAGPAVVRGMTTAGGGGSRASARRHRAGLAISPLTRRGLGRGARRARHARQCGPFDNQQRCRGHPPRRARHGGGMRSRRGAAVVRVVRGLVGTPRAAAAVPWSARRLTNPAFGASSSKTKSRRSRKSNVEGTRMRSRRGAAVVRVDGGGGGGGG